MAITTLAASIPTALGSMGRSSQRVPGIFTYTLVAATIGLSWFKRRRLIVLDRHIQGFQIVLTGLVLTSVVLVPKIAALVLRHGAGRGSLWLWSYAQVVNTVCLSLMMILNMLCFLYALSLSRRRGHHGRHRQLLRGIVHSQLWRVLAISALLSLELMVTWFDTQDLLMIPLILLFEEAVVIRGFLR